MLLWAFVIEPRRLVVNAVDLKVSPRLDRPLRVAALSDIHVGSPHWGTGRVREAVARTNALQPDVVVLLGDYVITGVVGGTFVAPEVFAPVLGGLRAPGGVYAVIGNHDGWLDTVRVRRALEAAGIVVLENDARPLPTRTDVWMAGLADAWTGTPEIQRTLRGVDPRAATLLLTHGPDVFPDVPRTVALTLAGHTHGGQIAPPLLGPLIVPSRYGVRFAAGHIVEDGRQLFVTTGLGTSIIPARLGVPPEIVLLTLR